MAVFGNDEQFQYNLVDFLSSELDLSFTFCGTAQTSLEVGDPEHYVVSLGKARNALETTRRLEGRIGNPELWQQIHERADRLENIISRLGDSSLS